MGREVEAASALLIVSTVSVLNVEYRMCSVRGEQKKLRNALLLSLSASLGSEGRMWEGRKGHAASFLFLLLDLLLFHNLHFGDSYCITVN